MKLFETHVTIAADSVDEIKPCHVYRLVESSQDVNGMDPQLFADWLMGQRPDLSSEVCESLKEIRQ